MEDAVKEFILLFRGRSDVYGHSRGYCVNEPLTAAVFERHLNELDPEDHIGVYCMIGQLCSWGCIDIDGKDFPVTKLNPDWPHVGNHDPQYIVQHDWDHMWALAYKLTAAARDNHGIHLHMERTKNGIHLWCFPSEPLVQAAWMRRALMAVCVECDYQPKEVNPKAEGPRPGTRGLGNFVRLPYGGGLHYDWRPLARYIVNDATHEPYSLLDFLGAATRTPASNLEEASKLWTPPPARSLEIRQHTIDVDEILPLLSGKAFVIWRDGPYPIELGGSGDRSGTLARLAYTLAEQGLPPEIALTVLRSADERWGKFYARADGEEQLFRILERAYA